MWEYCTKTGLIQQHSSKKDEHSDLEECPMIDVFYMMLSDKIKVLSRKIRNASNVMEVFLEYNYGFN